MNPPYSVRCESQTELEAEHEHTAHELNACSPYQISTLVRQAGCVTSDAASYSVSASFREPEDARVESEQETETD